MEEKEDWWPTKEEYDPEISKDEWIELLHDEKIFDFNSMCMLHRMLDVGGEATNSELSKKYKTMNGYNGIVKALAKRIIEETNCKLPPQEENAKRWPVLFIGKKVKKDDEHDGVYIWKLRPELEDALKQMDTKGELEKYPLYENNKKGESTMPTENNLVTKLDDLLKNTHNLILHGAPGTGKTYLAKEIAAQMIFQKTDLTDDEKKQLEEQMKMVQFHPNYDYTDFVEGLRPVKSSDGTSSIGFERKDGVFKEFCKRAVKNLTVINFLKKLEKEKSHLYTIDYGLYSYYDFFVENFNQQNDEIAICSNGEKDGKEFKNELSFSQLDKIIQCKENINSFEDMKNIFSDIVDDNEHHEIYYYCLYKEFKKIESTPFLFIIDEINRGELSKIFGELFYEIEPAYRGEKGRIQTQYQNLVEESDVFKSGFFIPENVYIIGTMNDIDRSVDTMDFAFRRRFTFCEIKAEENLSMLDELGNLRDEAENRMKNLNNAISAIEGLNSSYNIGGAYFLKLNDFSGSTEEKFVQLWNYHLEGLLREYLRGRDDAETKLPELKNAYDNASHSD